VTGIGSLVRCSAADRRRPAIISLEYEVIAPGEAEAAFRVSESVRYPFAEFADQQEIRLYRGGRRVDGDLRGEPATDWSPYNLIVDGDLVIDGDLDWWDYGGGNFLLVTGDLTAQSVILQGCPTVVVRGDLTATHGIQGHHGDDGGYLKVGGQVTAPIIVSTLYFNVEFAHPPRATLVADPYRCNVPVDFDDDELSSYVRPELLDEDGSADERKMAQALRAGHAILRPSAVPAHVAAVAELDRLLDDPELVTTIDLSDRKLRSFPEQLFGFPHLRRLSLARNSGMGPVPARIGELGTLEELDLSSLDLTSLPDTIGDLSELRVLNISSNSFAALPARLADLRNLTTLQAAGLTCPLPETVSGLSNVEEIDLRDYQPGPNATGVPFPRVVTRLPKLRRLVLAMTPLESIPDDLTRLSTLEELVLDGSLGLVPALPNLAELLRLRVLHMDGRCANSGPYPRHDLLDAVWSVSTLETLGLDRWGRQTTNRPQRTGEHVLRPALTMLPDDAFSRMPHLRVLDLSFNELTTLPESFYLLTDLTEVDLRYTHLDRATINRLTATFPRVRLDLRNVASADTTTTEVDDPHWRHVHDSVKAAAQRGNTDQAATDLEQALALCTPGSRYSDYDQLYAYYRLVDVLDHLIRETDNEQGADALRRQLVQHAQAALRLLPNPGFIWHFTQFGAFQEEVTRRTGNALAWTLMQLGDLHEALSVADRALTYADSHEFDYIRDTKVRILLAAGRTDEAYRIVDQVLTRDPDFDDFQDLKHDPDYQAWRAINS
jgi:hypothetical protein